jgi:hypothetical protein
MLSKIEIDSEEFLNTVEIYFEKESFRHNQEIFKTLTECFEEFKEAGEAQFNRIFSVKNDFNKKGDLNIITYKFNLEFLVSRL